MTFEEEDETGSEEVTELEVLGSELTGSEETGSEETGSEETGSEETGSIDEIGSDDTGSEEVGSAEVVGSEEETGSEETGSDETGASEDTGSTRVVGSDETGSSEAAAGAIPPSPCKVVRVVPAFVVEFWYKVARDTKQEEHSTVDTVVTLIVGKLEEAAETAVARVRALINPFIVLWICIVYLYKVYLKRKTRNESTRMINFRHFLLSLYYSATYCSMAAAYPIMDYAV